ncbi:type II toxin-antitoxin system prevent-host-death family antitoxin [Deinococcus sp. SM5_A1]|uniref:type II toxin-antitoxin system prevent-host-death family antitoxin n=1 Tax=Deinococcus sp. SM5_A1 TaxID=3379094 RepID=UPI0038588F2F
MAPPRRSHLYSGTEIRAELTAALEQVMAGDHVLITRHGKPVAALIGLGAYQQLTAPVSPAPQETVMQVISVYNQAGGAGKTTITMNLGYALKQRGFRVLLIDMDPQASLTRWLGLLTPTAEHPVPPAEKLSRTVFQVLSDPDEALPEPLSAFGLDVIPANSKLSAGDSLLYSERERLTYLRRAIRARGGYDFVLLDGPPGRSALALAAVAASDQLIIPINVSKSMDNLGNVGEFLREARQFSPDLSVLSLTMHSFMANTRHHQEMLKTVTEQLSAIAPATTPITHKATLYNDAALYQQPVAVYAPHKSPRTEFDTLADEILILLQMPERPEMVR